MMPQTPQPDLSGLVTSAPPRLKLEVGDDISQGLSAVSAIADHVVVIDVHDTLPSEVPSRPAEMIAFFVVVRKIAIEFEGTPQAIEAWGAIVREQICRITSRSATAAHTSPRAIDPNRSKDQ